MREAAKIENRVAEVRRELKALAAEIDGEAQKARETWDAAEGVKARGEIAKLESRRRGLQDEMRELLSKLPEAKLEDAREMFAEADARAADQRQRAEEAERQLRDAREFDESTFWFRRFHTSLGLAHGAAFVGLANSLFNKDTPTSLVASLLSPMVAFGAGMLMAGTIPLALHAKRARFGWGLALTSAVLFLLGVLGSLIAVWTRGQPAIVWPWQL